MKKPQKILLDNAIKIIGCQNYHEIKNDKKERRMVALTRNCL